MYELQFRTEFRRPRFCCVLMPVYRIRYEYRGRTRCGVLNGQTGAAASDVTRSGAKIVWTVIAIAAIAAFLIYELSLVVST